jgi:hypothetical protein
MERLKGRKGMLRGKVEREKIERKRGVWLK